MKRQLNTILIVLLLGLTISCSSESKSKEGLKEASLRLGWVPSASFSGEIAGMKKFDEDRNLNLTVQAGGPGANSTQLVQTGENTFGTLAADEVLAANDKGASFVIIGVINYYSPGGFVSLEGSNITKPSDFEGNTVGILPFGSTTLLYRSMLRENNVDRSEITEITVSSDLRQFINGNYDVHPVFVYDETVTLDQRGIGYNLIEPKEFGVTLKGPVYFCTRETFENKPEVVEAFVKTMADGWNYAIQNPDSAITMLKDFAPEIDEDRERQVLEKGIPYFSAYKDQPINSDINSWENEVNELKRFGIIENDMNISQIVKLEYIHDYYSENN